jgi:hypothetical protein
MKETSFVLRVCRNDGSSHYGFKWPLQVGASVEASDWSAYATCGHGLHGWLHGDGDPSLASKYLNHYNALWYVLEVETESLVTIECSPFKCKFPRAVVRFIGSLQEARAFLLEHDPKAKPLDVMGAVRADNVYACTGALGVSAAGLHGDAVSGMEGVAAASSHGIAQALKKGVAAAGNYGTAKTGYHGLSIAGMYGLATTSDDGVAVAGAEGNATAGTCGTAVTGDGGCANAGEEGTAVVRDSGCAISGNNGLSVALTQGHARSGDYGVAIADISVTAGKSGTLVASYYDASSMRYRLVVGYIGEDGLKPGVPYRLNDQRKFVENVEE